MQNIQQFNEELVKNNEDITITEYITKVNDLFYKIEINFMNDLMEMVDKDECCIDHKLLVKYGITNLTAGSVDVKKIIDRNDGCLGSDYKISELAYRDYYTHKIDYFLHPTFFKKNLLDVEILINTQIIICC